MILYLWIKEHNLIKNTGINLSSKYHFDFIIEDTKNDITSGRLECKVANPINIFHESIIDVKAIVGENGAGKSTVIQVLIDNIMNSRQYQFNGFFITDQYIFNRNGIVFTGIPSILGLDLKILDNAEIVNYGRNEYNKIKNVHAGSDGQIASRHLSHQSIIHYSPLLNADRIENIEGVAGSNKIFETNFWHFFDYGTENCIVNDYRELTIGEAQSQMTGESELLAHKSAESRRTLLFLATFNHNLLPFDNKINLAYFSFNDFYERFWETLDINAKKNKEEQGALTVILRQLDQTNTSEPSPVLELEYNMYKSYIFGALKYEYKHRMNFSREDDSNPWADTLAILKKASERKKSYKSTLKSFLEMASFCQDDGSQLFNKLERSVVYVVTSNGLVNKSAYGFNIHVKDSGLVNELLDLIYNVFTLKEGGRSFVFNIFSIDYRGLSSGEKSILSMFGRFKEAVDLMPPTQTEVVFLLDEPEVALHPQWQTLFFDTLNTCLPILFVGKSIQIIITSHSPIIVSDLPLSNIVFLAKDKKTGECIVSNIYGIDNTFAANIHTLYANAFFLNDKGGTMGKLAKRTINRVITLIKQNKTHPLAIDQIQFCKKVINSVGEPLIRDQLRRMFYDQFPDQKVTNLDARIEYLQNALDEALKTRNE